MNKNNQLIIAISAMAVISLVLVITVIGLQMKLGEVNTSLKKTQQTFETETTKAKEQITKGLKEKHRADMVSYEAMAKRAALETQKRRELENELKGK